MSTVQHGGMGDFMTSARASFLASPSCRLHREIHPLLQTNREVLLFHLPVQNLLFEEYMRLGGALHIATGPNGSIFLVLKDLKYEVSLRSGAS